MKKYINGIKKYIIGQIGWSMFGIGCLAVTPLLQEWLFDYGLKSSGAVILQVIVLYFILLLLYAVSEFFCMLFMFRGGINFEQELKKDFFQIVFHMSNEVFTEKTVGEYVALQGNDITALEQDYLEPFIDMIKSINTMIIYGIVLFAGVDWRLALVIILSSVISIAIPKMMGKKLTGIRSVCQNQMAKYVSVITDLLEGFRVINSRNVQQIESVHDKNLLETSKKRWDYGKRKSLVLSVSELFTKIVRGCTFAAIAILFFKGEITIGMGVATLSYVFAFINPIDNILYDVTTMQSMHDVREKVLSYMKKGQSHQMPIQNFKKEISVFGVCLQKGDFKIQDLNLQIEKGKKYAITGPSGSGKSTLLKMLANIESPQKGTIEMDGNDIKERDISSLIAYVDQQEHIYQANFMENVSVFHAYKMDGIKKYAERLSAKILKDVADRGEKDNCQNFSGGEKQAIAFLRMLAQNAEIFLLDEPFSAMDEESRRTLENFLFMSAEFENKTILMITHHTDHETLSYFDQVLYVKNGCVRDIFMPNLRERS